MGFVKKVFKSASKIVKKVAKVVKKAAPYLVLAAAIYFTAGAALGAGALGATGGLGWATGVKAMVAKMGMSGAAASMLTTSVTYAGYGAVTGVATSLVTGGDPMEGLKKGAIGGAITGGVMGGVGHAQGALAAAKAKAAGGVVQTGTLPAGVSPLGTGKALTAASGAAKAGAGPLAITSASPVAGSGLAGMTTWHPPGTVGHVPGGGSGSWSDAIKAAIKTPEFLGHAVSGVGTAISGWSQSREMKADRQAAKDRWDQISGSYEGMDTATPIESVQRPASDVSTGVSQVSAATPATRPTRPIEPPSAAPRPDRPDWNRDERERYM